ncbi:hypothetical protein DFH09DRAFT_1313039 [Mycena vulgaris]|nr:hypothetical protein DFH09DRAFT_1313039 [Mycena vulgaris]
MRAFLFTSIVASLLISANMAAAQNLSDQQKQCLSSCSTTAGTGGGCNGSQNQASCLCASPAYAANFAQCAASSCQIGADEAKTVLAQQCSLGSGGSAPPAGKPNSARFNVNGGYMRAAAVSAAGFVVYALFV